MTIPNTKVLDGRVKKIKSLEKTLGDGKLTDQQMCAIMRTSVRKSWMMSPVKLLKLEKAKISDMRPETRTLWLLDCEICKNRFKMKDVQVDHIKGEFKMKTLDDVTSFARSILDVTEDDLQVVCTPCHEIKTYAERYDLSFRDATTEKKIISYLKNNKVDAVKADLLEYGYSGKDVSNPTKRKVLLRKLILEGKING